MPVFVMVTAPVLPLTLIPLPPETEVTPSEESAVVVQPTVPEVTRTRFATPGCVIALKSLEPSVVYGISPAVRPEKERLPACHTHVGI